MAEGTNEKIVDRVRKLLELSKSSNVHEAASAAEKAQELMTRYEIASAVLASESGHDAEDDEGVMQGLFHRDGKTQLARWKLSLADAICKVNACKAYGQGADLCVVGRPSAAARARTLFLHVSTEIDRLARDAARERGNPGRTWINNFRVGATGEIRVRLDKAFEKARADMQREAVAQGGTGGVALVRVNDALAKLDQRKLDVKAYVASHLKLRSAQSNASFDADARREGARAAANIDLNGRARLGRGVAGALK